MNTFLIALGIFLFAYLINIFYITVLYHRGLAHSSVELSAFTRKLTIHTGMWITGIDPKSWACMHRFHHRYSDTKLDPHSPWHYGVFGVLLGQLHSYENTVRGLARNAPPYIEMVSDLDFPVSILCRNRIWILPYLLHAGIATAIAFALHSPFFGLAYWFGIMSHPIQGWLVNSFAHRFGYQNFQNGDESRNNTLIAWLVMGEGYQNNHHANPGSAKFSARWFEFDGGYAMCVLAKKLRLLQFPRAN